MFISDRFENKNIHTIFFLPTFVLLATLITDITAAVVVTGSYMHHLIDEWR